MILALLALILAVAVVRVTLRHWAWLDRRDQALVARELAAQQAAAAAAQARHDAIVATFVMIPRGTRKFVWPQ
jgi:hypothetical protein